MPEPQIEASKLISKYTNHAVRTTDMLRVLLHALHDTVGLPWRQIAEFDVWRSTKKRVSPGTLASINNGNFDPVGNDLRDALLLTRIDPIELKPCAAKRRRKDCQGMFKPNVPWRKSCYICSPLRKHKEKARNET